MQIRKVVVVGAGQMGNGIAQVAAAAGYDVIMTDVADELVQEGMATIRANLERAVLKKHLSGSGRDHALGRICTGLSFEAGRDADLLVEATPEAIDTKREVLSRATAILRDDAIIASNTSSLSITQLANTVDRPDRFVGIHFFNPVPAMKLCEVVTGLLTSSETAATVRGFVERLGKKPVMVKDSPGFVVNRILLPMINEAVYALMEGISTADDIDSAMVAGANHPLGPLALADLIGLDTTLAALEVLQHDLGDPKYRPCPLLRRYVAAGRLGRKSGAGFFNYT